MLISRDYTSILKDCEDFAELGLWPEIVQPQVEEIGEIWRGRYQWDWNNEVGFLICYETEARKKCIDVAMEKFKSVFGY